MGRPVDVSGEGVGGRRKGRKEGRSWLGGGAYGVNGVMVGDMVIYVHSWKRGGR